MSRRELVSTEKLTEKPRRKLSDRTDTDRTLLPASVTILYFLVETGFHRRAWAIRRGAFSDREVKIDQDRVANNSDSSVRTRQHINELGSNDMKHDASFFDEI